MSWPMSPEHGSGLGHASSKPNSAGILGRTQTAGRRGSKSVMGETEALNHMIDGHGLMHLGDQTFDVLQATLSASYRAMSIAMRALVQ